jgi:AhpC/TSA antioxidant enzyme
MSSHIYSIFVNENKLRVGDGQTTTIIIPDDVRNKSYQLIVVLPQLGDFDSLEYAWWLKKEGRMLEDKNIVVKAIAIGNLESGQKFCQYTGFPPENLFMDETASIHQKLNLYQGLKWDLPFLSQRGNAWWNLLLMCAGIGSKGTLKEVFRGYKGDKQAPPLFQDEDEISIGFLPLLKGAFFKTAGTGYQRPFELATLRLQNMVEVLNHWGEYVHDDRYLTQRGGTFLFDDHGKLLYEHRDQGILGFAANMSQPLDFMMQINAP